MSVINYTAQDLTFGTGIYTWSGLTAGDTGSPIGAPGAGDRTVQVSGIFDVGGTVLIEGTLDMVNWNTLRDPFGANLSFTSSGLKAILENVIAVRPNVQSGGVATSLNVVLITRKSLNG